MYSIVIPVFRNEETLALLIDELEAVAVRVAAEFHVKTEVIFVVDASPDNSAEILSKRLSTATFASKLVSHSRNFGSFAAIRTGLAAARGDYFGVIAADRQEPTELLLNFIRALKHDESGVVIGVRTMRSDRRRDALTANLFWRFYRRIVMPDVPEGGADVFACTRQVRDQLLMITEANSSLVGQIFWLGFKRSFVSYERRRREHGKSGWTFRKKVKYLLDSVYAFTDLPIRLITIAGLLGVSTAIIMAIVVLGWRLGGFGDVPGYAATMIAIFFFGGLNALGIGIIGAYAWRTYENTKQRPLSVIEGVLEFHPEKAA
jgi:glycosyltransferase involved in cell wall biosynthesis